MYQTEFKGVRHELGTSGFLYRSNKLMYDHGTKSLWSTLMGAPVVGPLVGAGIRLERSHVVTTTWGAWKERNPETTVLSLNTGHVRDYTEGAAYREYFATDRLMFTVPETDNRLQNKDEVLALRAGNEQLAISAEYLRQHLVFQDEIGSQEFVILTDSSGANRVYESQGVAFESWDGEAVATDSQQRTWTVTEESLTLGDRRLYRLPAHRAFWFGWYSQFPDSRLIR